VDVKSLFMALPSSRGISTPSLQAQGEQRRTSYFNNHRDIAFPALLRRIEFAFQLQKPDKMLCRDAGYLGWLVDLGNST
jgi:hypothetical protein